MMTPTRLSKFVLTVAAVSMFASAASAFQRNLTDQQRATNTYPVYQAGQGGCVDDRGHGVVSETCSDN